MGPSTGVLPARVDRHGCDTGLLLVIHPQTLIVHADLPLLLPSLASMVRGQRYHLSYAYCMMAKDRDGGSDLFIIKAYTRRPATAVT